MAEIDPIEEKSLLYVLGELSAEEKRRFEEEMDAAPELMERVRELEEGAAALALACPPKRLPKQVWTNIEKAIETERRVVVPWEWFQNKGWAAAAACAAGWLLYAIFTGAPKSANERLEAKRAEGVSTDGVNGASVARDEASGTNRFAAANRDRAEERSRADASATELAALHGQVRLLQGQLAQISQAVTQRQALLNDPARLKFIGLAPVRDGAVNSTNGLSPQLQHAIGLAMARELGWLGSSNVWTGGAGDEFSRGGGMTNIGGVDFIDLRAQQAGTNSDTPANFRAPLDLAQSNENNPAAPTDSGTKPSTLLPAFASNDHVTVALDNSVGPPGSQITLSSAGANGVPVVIGSAVLGNNPVVLTFSPPTGDRSASLFSAGADGGSFLTVTTSMGGVTNQYQFFPTPGP